MRPFPDHPMLRGNFAPILVECDATDLVVHGDLPPDLIGTLYRNGPNPMYPPFGAKHHWFLGEGMVHAIHLEGGKAHYRNRYVKTAQFNAQREAGKRLVGTSFGEANGEGGEEVDRNVANTNIVAHAGRLLALDEGSLPVAMDPNTLETVGSLDFNGHYSGPMTAHPKIDPETGEYLCFGYMAGGPASPQMSYSVVSPAGVLTRHDRFSAPFASMVHDFVATKRHAIFPIFPATIDAERIMNGGPVIAWDPDAGTHFGIVGRDDGMETMRWFKGDPAYVYHFMNAYSVKSKKGTQVYVDAMKYDRVPLFPNADGSRGPSSSEGLDENGQFVRWSFDLDGATDAYTEEKLCDIAGEFPRFDERFAGLKYAHGFFATTRRPDEIDGSFDTLVHVDVTTGETTTWEPGKGCFVHEPIFVPRSTEAPEGDGYLLSLVYDARRNLSDFVILDTEDISKGPIARAELPVRVPFGFHGNWRPLP